MPFDPEVQAGAWRTGGPASRQSRKGAREYGGVRSGGGRACGRGEPPRLHQGAGVGSRFQVAGGRVRALVGWVGSRAAPLSVRALGPAQNVKQLYALVCETQRYSAVLDAVIGSAGLLGAEKKLRPHLAKVMGGVGL